MLQKNIEETFISYTQIIFIKTEIIWKNMINKCLEELLSEKIRQGEYQGKEGAVALARRNIWQSMHSSERYTALSRLSGVYFSAAIYLGSLWHLSENIKEGRQLRHKGRLYFAAATLTTFATMSLVPKESMNYTQLDISSAVLLGIGWNSTALSYLDQGLDLPEISVEQEVELLIKKGKALDKLRQFTEADGVYREAITQSNTDRLEVKSTKEYGIHFLRYRQAGLALEWLGYAMDIAEDAQLIDQQKKLKALIQMAEKGKLEIVL